MKKFYRGLYGVLTNLQISISNVELVFRGFDHQKSGSMAFDDFVRCLKEFDVSRRIDFDVTYDVCKRYINT